MDFFETVDEDEDFEVALLTSSREAFTGFSNLDALPLVPRWQTPPWRRPAEFSNR
jgi:hypothetical protein